MGTPFMEIYDSMLTIIDDYKLDKKFIENKEITLNFLKGFIRNGIPSFKCIKSLEFIEVEEDIGTEEEPILVKRNYFVEDLDIYEISIISKIAVSVYYKRKIQDVRAYEQYMSQREFKKESSAQGLKEKSNWYQLLVNEYKGDIEDYNIEHLAENPFWGGL